MHQAALKIALDPSALMPAPAVTAGNPIPVSRVTRKDGSEHVYDFNYHLRLATTNPRMGEDLERVWLIGAMLTLGDAVGTHDYFGNVPEIQLLRHMRNGIAHGNRFKISRPGELRRFPAHNRLAYVKASPGAPPFEITPELNGASVLFDYMGPADCVDLLFSIEMYLLRTAFGQEPRA